MADISKCRGTDCSKKEQCYRYLVEEDKYRQAYSAFFKGKSFTKEKGCSYFWNIKKKGDRNDY